LNLAGVTADTPVVVSGSGASYTVTVNTIAGDGTLGLDIDAGHDIADPGGNALNTTPTTDDVYTIDNTVPTVAITRDYADPTAGASVIFSVDFSEDAVNVDATDFTLDLAGVMANATVTVGNADDADAATYTVTVDTITCDGTLGLDIDAGNDIIDVAGLALNSTPTTDDFYTVERGDGVFSYRRPIVIDHTKVGDDDDPGTVPASGAPGFPVLVSITMEVDEHWLKWSGAHASGHVESEYGHDIVFRESTDIRKQLYHEIESYDGTDGTLTAWVRVDDLSKAEDTTIYMYYGNGCITAATESPTDVWDSNYKGVWHLDEEQSGTGTNDLYTDSTSNNNHGNDLVSATGQDGKVDAGQQFDDVDDYIVVDNSASLGITGDITVEAWVKRSNLAQSTILSKTNGSRWDYDFYLDDNQSGGQYRVRFWADGAGYLESTGTITDAFWHHVAVTRIGDAVTFYIDGSSSGGGEMTIAFNNNADPVWIGDDNSNTGEFAGHMDEIRLSNTDRSADWIATEFNNQDDATPGAGNFIKDLGVEAMGFATAIDLLSFSATGADGAVQVDWQTAAETGNLGFYLYRATSPAGPFVRITDQLIAGLNYSVEGRAYTYADTDVTTGQPYYYKLEDLDMDGQRTFHGPVGVDWDGAGAPAVNAGDPDPAPWEPGGEAGPVVVSDADEPVYKIMVAGEGLYRLSRDFLAGQAVALDRVDLSRVRLYHQGREVAVWVHDANGDTVFDDSDHITFYALPVGAEFAKYSADNVYWLTTGAGENTVKRMAAVDAAPDNAALAGGFDTTVQREQDQYYYPAAPGADERDRWLYSTWVVGDEIAWQGAGQPMTFTLDTPGPAAPAP
jgi:hypothetical protein